jgi:hypothetical protein
MLCESASASVWRTTAPLPDTRKLLLITHNYSAMVTVCMVAITAGYEDGDDLDVLRQDPALMITCNRAPEGPKISRWRTWYWIGGLRHRQTERLCAGVGVVASDAVFLPDIETSGSI